MSSYNFFLIETVLFTPQTKIIHLLPTELALQLVYNYNSSNTDMKLMMHFLACCDKAVIDGARSGNTFSRYLLTETFVGEPFNIIVFFVFNWRR